MKVAVFTFLIEWYCFWKGRMLAVIFWGYRHLEIANDWESTVPNGKVGSMKQIYREEQMFSKPMETVFHGLCIENYFCCETSFCTLCNICMKNSETLNFMEIRQRNSCLFKFICVSYLYTIIDPTFLSPVIVWYFVISVWASRKPKTSTRSNSISVFFQYSIVNSNCSQMNPNAKMVTARLPRYFSTNQLQIGH